MYSSLKATFATSALTGTLLLGNTGFTTANAESVVGAGALSFSVGVFSDYLDDGASASNNNAVVQGGIDYSHDSGVYFGTGLSTLGDGDGQEVELYAGYGFAAGAFDFDVGYAYSYYPALDDADLGEIYGAVAYGPVYFGIDYTAHADDNGGDSGDVTYRIGAEYEVVPTIGLNGEIGHADPDASDADGVTFWQLGLTKSSDVGDFSLAYGSTDESGSQDLFVVGYSISF